DLRGAAGRLGRCRHVCTFPCGLRRGRCRCRACRQRVPLRRDPDCTTEILSCRKRRGDAAMSEVDANAVDRLDWAKGEGLLPAIVQHWRNGEVLMLGNMNREALAATRASGKVTFFSRSRQRLWCKGETSGNHLLLK